MTKRYWRPTIGTNCADCGVGTMTLGEWYTVQDEVREQAWAGRLKPWHELDGQQIPLHRLSREAGLGALSCHVISTSMRRSMIPTILALLTGCVIALQTVV
jgi:hypothetical protein